jgi:hypothetical protein
MVEMTNCNYQTVKISRLTLEMTKVKLYNTDASRSYAHCQVLRFDSSVLLEMTINDSNFQLFTA